MNTHMFIYTYNVEAKGVEVIHFTIKGNDAYIPVPSCGPVVRRALQRAQELFYLKETHRYSACFFSPCEISKVSSRVFHQHEIAT